MPAHNDLLALHAANPLLIPLGQYVERREDWLAILAYDPLNGIDRKILSIEQRMASLDDIGTVVEPTNASLDLIVDVQDMMRSSLRMRNPLIPAAREQRLKIIGFPGQTLAALPWFNTPIEGKLVDGVTGMGKTHPLARYLGHIPKVWVHERNEAAGWKSLTQIVFLYLKMPHDGFRGGLLRAFIEAIDERLGTTSYADQYRNVHGLEVLAVIVGRLLVSHFCGLVVLDDLQLGNFTLSQHREEMLLLMLKLVDFGIPLILVGNPLALSDVHEFSQNVRRLTSREPIHLHPYEPSNKDWRDGLVPTIWRHDLMPNRTKLTPELRKMIDISSAGFPDYAAKIRVGVQRSALRAGKLDIDLPFLESWLSSSETMKEARSLLTGFREKDPWLLSTLRDIPWQQYGLMWGKLTIDQLVEQEKSISQPKKAAKGGLNAEERKRSAIQLKLARAFSRSQAAKETKAAANKKIRDDARSDDWRTQHTDDVISAPIEDLKKKVLGG